MKLLRNKTIWFTAAFVLAAIMVLVLSTRPARLAVKMADGTVLSVQKVSFGQRESLQPVTWQDQWKQRLVKWLPGPLAARFPALTAKGQRGSSSWGTAAMGSNGRTNLNALHIYLNRHDPVTGKFVSVEVGSGDLVDEHGCVLVMASMSGEDRGLLPPQTNSPAFGGAFFGGTIGRGGFMGGHVSSMIRLTFEDFPRWQKQFRLRVYDDQFKPLGEFLVPNPAWPPVKTNWNVEPFPVTTRDGSVTYTLTRLTYKTNADYAQAGSQIFKAPYGIEPVFEVRSNDRQVTNWTVTDMDLTDVWGNLAPKLANPFLFLCTQQPAWKLTAKFSGADLPPPGSNSIWTLTNLKVPAAGEFTALDLHRVLQGISVSAVAIAGPAEVVYSNNVPFSARVIEDDESGSIISTMNGMARLTTVRQKTVCLALDDGMAMNRDEWLALRAKDEQGREYTAESAGGRRGGRGGRGGGGGGGRGGGRGGMSVNWGRALSYYDLNLPPEAKTITLTITLEGARAEEFIFKPPPMK